MFEYEIARIQKNAHCYESTSLANDDVETLLKIVEQLQKHQGMRPETLKMLVELSKEKLPSELTLCEQLIFHKRQKLARQVLDSEGVNWKPETGKDGGV